ncbi:MAG: DUF1587 domain-containing protein, partial [Bryobacteraceae bacterium]
MTVRLLQCACLLAALGTLTAGPAGNASKSSSDSKSASFEQTVKPFMAKNCFMCHNAKMKSGEVDLQHHSASGMVLKDRDVWEQVVHKIRTGEMPPKGLPRPKPEDIELVTNWIEGEYERIDRNTKPDPGRVTARRLNRTEYNNTIHDLLHVSLNPADDFPADDSGYGFDNIGDVLSLSPVLMERYLNAAVKISRAAIIAEPPKFKPTRKQYQAEDLEQGQHVKNLVLREGVAGPPVSRHALHITHDVPAQAHYDIRVGVGGIRPEGEPVEMAFWVDGKQEAAFTVDPRPGEGRRRSFEVRLPLAAGSHDLGVAFVNDTYVQHGEAPNKRSRYLSIDAIEIRGPYNAVPPPLPESHKLLMTCAPVQGQEMDCARRILEPVIRRAYRRPVTAAEVDGILQFAKMALDEGDSFERSIQVALQAVLISPHFLFRIERDPDPLDPESAHKIKGYEMASRLSYFLWSTMPDEELMRLAGEKKLLQPEVLEAQVRRMLRDPKSKALADN